MSNRENVISRVQKELIGPGSDLFECEDKENFSDEVIADKPLLRYFSGILYPKQNAIDDFHEDDDESDETPIEIAEEKNDNAKDNNDIIQPVITKEKEDGKEVQYSANTFFPSQYGISFAVSKDCPELKINLSFGNYKKAKANEIAIEYGGDSVDLLEQFGLQPFVVFDSENKLLKQTKELTKQEKQQRSSCLNSLGKDHRDSGLYKTLTKLFFKDKYKRYDNRIETTIAIDEIKQSENQYYKILLSEIPNANSDQWWKSKNESLKDYLYLHIKLYEQSNSKYVVRVFIENTLLFPRTKFSIAKETLNQTCLFQTEIKVETPYLQPFNDYKNNLYKSEEDRMLDFLYREKLSYGIGHNTACTWEDCENDTKTPIWISSTFLPQFNVKSQSTDIEGFDKKQLEIKELSSFNSNKDTIVSNLKKLVDAYLKWIENEEKETSKLSKDDKILALSNIEKCKIIHKRMQKGIELLESNDNAFRAFQLANTAIYLQMFQNQWHFNKQKDGFEAFERTDNPQYTYQEYATKDYPDTSRVPSWRPFQLAFILQCLPSFVEESSADRDLVDLLYFPTGGGKTEAYLALSAFLIFWRRLQYPNSYGGVNIIIRYTLRLLSAQQFERATKLILACEFIRKNHSDLGNEKITIGFWVGGSTIPNTIKEAKDKLSHTQERLNSNKQSINPFQLSNCQWCNTKIIGKTQESNNPSIGHRISRQNQLSSHCLNPNCAYSEQNDGLPIVLVDEDIYSNPPTMLFATVDKFAQLAWKGEATSLFNHKDDRKPELIIQDELHLLSGPLGSLVGLFENIILSLCTTDTQKPKIIASTATVKNVEEQVKGLYNRAVQIFPQNATNSDNTFFSKTLLESKRRYVGILPTGKTQTMTNLRLNAALLFARLELWKNSVDKTEADQFWTILSYFKSLKHVGRFSNKITAELLPEIKQLQVRYLMNVFPYNNNYSKLPYRNLELTSRIPNERIKKNLDKLDIPFEGDLEKYKSYDIVLATNMISVGLDVERLNIMLMNGMPPNTAEYIQASSRVARKNEGIVFSLFDPNNTRDLSYFEDFVPFHKTFYKQVEPISVTPFAENALDKMLFTSMIAYFRHKMGFAANNMATALNADENKQKLISDFNQLFNDHAFADEEDKQVIKSFMEVLIQQWDYKIQRSLNLHYFGSKTENKRVQNLLNPIQEREGVDDKLVGMQSMRSVEPSATIKIKRF
ncbi:MAG: Helicase protein [Bacteroidetes bacterium 38_7]|nr:MAG: Helicase protein [Bacteroidetes bacterium 38_7]